jgi:hypothetical protein
MEADMYPQPFVPSIKKSLVFALVVVIGATILMRIT